jgi:predicted MPP superfamily phosphohydrolase
VSLLTFATLMGALVLGLVVLAVWVRWLDHRLAVLPEWSTGVRRTAGVLLVLGPLLFVGAEVWAHELDPAPVRAVLWVALTWVAFAWYLTIGVLALTVFSGPLRLLGRRAARARRRLHRVGAPLVVVAALVVTGYGLHEAGDPRPTAYDVVSDDLPAGWDGARVVFLSDLHVGPVRDAAYTRRVVDLVNAQHPDVVLLGGDLVDGRDRYVGADLDPLADLAAPLGVFAVTGNHEFLSGDADAYVQRWESLGITPLRNENVGLQRGGDAIRLVGVHDVRGTGADAPDPGRALTGVDTDDFVLFLAHEPRQVVPDRGVDLQLSGHTHGGQLWPFRYVVPLQQPTIDGYDVVDGVRMITSRGVGAWGPPVRVGAPPEFVVVTLRVHRSVSPS